MNSNFYLVTWNSNVAQVSGGAPRTQAEPRIQKCKKKKKNGCL